MPMKRLLLFALFAFLSLAVAAQEQCEVCEPTNSGALEQESPKTHFLDFSTPNLNCRYEIRLGHTVPESYWFGMERTFGDSAWCEFDRSRYVEGYAHITSTPQLGGSVTLGKYFDFSLGLFGTMRHQTLYNRVTREPAEQLKHNSFYLLPQVRMNFVRTRYAKLYVGMGLDMGLDSHSESGVSYWASAAFKAGMTVGARIFGFQEISLSSVLLYYNIGLGYRF